MAVNPLSARTVMPSGEMELNDTFQRNGVQEFLRTAMVVGAIGMQVGDVEEQTRAGSFQNLPKKIAFVDV